MQGHPNLDVPLGWPKDIRIDLHARNGRLQLLAQKPGTKKYPIR
jgi:hypothetical protein